MKRFGILAVALIMMAALLTNCGKKETEDTTKEPPGVKQAEAMDTTRMDSAAMESAITDTTITDAAEAPDSM